MRFLQKVHKHDSVKLAFGQSKYYILFEEVMMAFDKYYWTGFALQFAWAAACLILIQNHLWIALGLVAAYYTVMIFTAICDIKGWKTDKVVLMCRLFAEPIPARR